MKAYNTKKRQALVSYLMKYIDHPLSAEMIHAGISGEQEISVSAVYRNLTRLVDDGIVHRLMSDDSKTALFRYVDCERCNSHLHMKCAKCGRIFHMNKEVSDVVLQSVKNGVRFTIDIQNTILYGVCDSCQ